MQKTNAFLVSQSGIRIVLLLSIFTFLYFMVILFIISDVYKMPVVGALYELLWLPMLLLLVALPIISLIQVIKGDKAIRMLSFFSLIQVIKGDKAIRMLSFFSLFVNLSTALFIALKYA